MILKGEKVILRPVEPDDVERIVSHINDEEVRSYLQMVFPLNTTREREWVENLYKDQKNLVFGIVPRNNEVIVGTTSFHNIDWIDRVAEFGIVIFDKASWNMGFGTEAIRLMLKYAFEHLNLHKVFLRVYEYNERAIHVYEKCGFKMEGRLRKQRFKWGKYHDVLIMGILDEEYFGSDEA
ncbi:MAG: GNAT family N-acetyltransferase [Thermotogaceae bacterium]|nr:GNAT family N-acetyltransferase [Thermotogaceae bacterium]